MPRNKRMTENKPILSFSEKGWFYLPSLALLLISALAVYLPSFNGPFIYDDLPNVIWNAYVRIHDLRLSSLYSAAFQDFGQNRPLSNMSFALDFYVHDERTFGYHLVNFILHIISGFSLFFILERIFSRKAGKFQYPRLTALLTSLLWLVHPINTQAVTYIVQRHTSLAGCFFLLSLLCYDLARTKRRTWLYILCAFFGILSLLCKETAFVLPGLILLYEIWLIQEFEPGWIKRTWKWLPALAGFYVLVALIMFRPHMAQAFKDDLGRLSYDPLERSLSQGRVLLWYVGLIIYPRTSHLATQHDIEISQSLFDPATTLPAFLVIFALIGSSLIMAKKYPLASFAVIWYFGNLLVESLPLPIALVFEHRLYLPSISIIALIPALLAMRVKKPLVGVCLTLVIGLFYGIMAYQRNLVWTDPYQYWRDSVSKAPGMASPWSNYCGMLLVDEKFKEAVLACWQALAIDPNLNNIYGNYGLALAGAGYSQEAAEAYEKAIKLKPRAPEPYYNMGLLMATLGHYEPAKAYFQKALELRPRNVPLLCDLAENLAILGELDDSFKAFRMALEIQPDSGEIIYRWASVLAGNGMCRNAMDLIAHYPYPDPRFAEIKAFCHGK